MDTPALAQLAGAYFHQDWVDEFDDEPDRAIDAFVVGTPDLAPQLPQEIDRVLEAMPDEMDVHTHLRSLGSHFTPATEDGDYRTWLRHVADRVRAATTSH